MSGFLLDVNVLISLVDPTHSHHERAHDWFAETGMHDWLSSPTTQNGALRIVSNPGYPNNQMPAIVATSLLSLCRVGSHRFVADRISLIEAHSVSMPAILSHRQVTDSYLLAVAQDHDAVLATFDRRLVTTAVSGGGSLVAQIP